MENEIIEMKQNFAVQKIVYPTEERIQEIENRFREFPKDMTVPENYVRVKAGTKIIKKLITATEARRKFLKKEALEYGRNVDKAAKIIYDRFKTVNEPMVAVVTAHEAKEEIKKREKERIEAERQENIETKINAISGLVSACILLNAGEMQDRIKALADDNITAWADEYKDTVAELKLTTLAQLNELYNMKLTAETANLAAEKAEAERVQREREEQKKRDAEQKAIRVENARLHAENDRLEKERVAAVKIIVDQKEAAEVAEHRAETAKKAAAEKKRSAEKNVENRKKAEIVTIQEFVSRSYHTENKNFFSTLVSDIQAEKFKHVKWVD